MTESKTQRTWEDHWAQGDTPWDAGEASPTLQKYVKEAAPAPGSRALVPGCGSGYDAFHLAAAGYVAVGLDLAESARPRFEQLCAERELAAAQVELRTGDFFALSPEELGGPFDFIWDYTFYCAIDPTQREAWKTQMRRLLAKDGTLAMLLFPVVPGAPADEGPPFKLDPDQVTAQLAPQFQRLLLEPAESSHPGREGKEWLSLWKHDRLSSG